METIKLKAILKSVELGSLKKAAEAMGYTPSAFSHTVTAVETELGVKIFNCGFNGITLTEEGKILLPAIKDAVRGIDKLYSTAANLEKTGGNIVKIGTFNSIAKNILPEIVAAFKIRYPEYGVNILVGDDLLNDLSTEKIDLFFGEEAIKGSYEFIPIKPDPYVAVFPKNANVKGRTIKKGSLYEYPSIITTDGVYATYFDKPLKNGTVITSDDYTSVLSMVEKGVGYALIPQISLSGKSKRFLTLKLDPPVMRTLGVIYDKRAVKKAAAEKFVAFVKKLSV